MKPTKHIFTDGRGPSSTGMDKTMKSHFKNFNTNFFKDTANPNHNKSLTFDKLVLSDITDELCGQFASYLSDTRGLHNETTDKKGNELPHLAYMTVIGYFSSFKTLLLLRFSGKKEELPNCLLPSHWKIYCDKVRRIKIRQSNMENKSLFGKYEAASNEDLKALSAVTFWSGSQTHAEFLALFLAQVTNCGRGSEVSSNYFIMKYLLTKYVIVKFYVTKYVIPIYFDFDYSN